LGLTLEFLGENMSASGPVSLSVALDLPAHLALGSVLTYLCERPLSPGTLVRVPLGKASHLGVVLGPAHEAPPASAQPTLRAIAEVLDASPPLPPAWLNLTRFAARYYQRELGEVMLAALPSHLRRLDAGQWATQVDKLQRVVGAESVEPVAAGPKPELNAEQAEALQAWRAAAGVAPRPTLLFGVTGSGKTEVYLRVVEDALAAALSQALVLVPEINLTPQLEARFAERFPGHAIVSLHSGLTPVQRLRAWLAAHTGRARIVLGTRMAVFASMPNLRLIVVDEEHDPSYKAQDGARHSARDLAVWRAQHEAARVLLGSATPSLESWAHAHRAASASAADRPADEPTGSSRYQLLTLKQRVAAAPLPAVRLLDMNRPTTALQRADETGRLLHPESLAALKACLARGEQSLVLLNRRGYAPVLHCAACGWKSECAHCSAWRVFHRTDRTLRCHHCGLTHRVPRACPECGNVDIQPLGHGTQKLEEQLAALLAGAPTAHGGSVRLARIDADSTRTKGSLQAQLAGVHAGEVDVLVGTQMVAKGHDFRRIALVLVPEPDGALFSHDFRAAERLFALLMQAGGRAGRAGPTAAAPSVAISELIVQTRFPTHPLFAALKGHDFEAFAAATLAERAQAGLPPHSHLALLRCEARTQAAAMAWLNAAFDAGQALLDKPGAPGVSLCPPVPAAMARLANVERAQLLVEAPRRAALQAFLRDWHAALHATSAELPPEVGRAVIRWAVDVDPQVI
jgi:primosomal protein N' (replication factor Y)